MRMWYYHKDMVLPFSAPQNTVPVFFTFVLFKNYENEGLIQILGDVMGFFAFFFLFWLPCGTWSSQASDRIQAVVVT